MPVQPAIRVPAPPLSRRERRKREVHERIVDAAVQRFERQGVEDTTVDEICAAADVAQKTFFNHFATRRDLVREIAAAFLAELLAIVAEIRHTPGPTVERLERLFARIAADAEAAGPLRRQLVMEVIRLVHDDHADAEHNRRLHDAFGALIRDGVRAGDVTRAHSVPVLTDMVVGAFYVLMLNWLGVEGYPMRARAVGVVRALGDVLAVCHRG
jgi:AcrR family transcriptional regulator